MVRVWINSILNAKQKKVCTFVHQRLHINGFIDHQNDHVTCEVYLKLRVDGFIGLVIHTKSSFFSLCLSFFLASFLVQFQTHYLPTPLYRGQLIYPLFFTTAKVFVFFFSSVSNFFFCLFYFFLSP